MQRIVAGQEAQSVMKRVLIIEDDAMLRELLRESFRERDFIVRDYASSREWKSQDDFEPTHAIIDLKLQGESGLDVLADLMRAHPECRALILTGYGSIATAVQAMKLGAVNYLTKPASPDDIEEAFDAMPGDGLTPLERPRLHEHEREYIEKVLQDMQGNISRAARVLGIHRQSLQRKLRKYT
jgi:two-component system response regulator RegA